MSARPLPAHWAAPHGLCPPPADPAAGLSVFELRRRQKAANAAFHGRCALDAEIDRMPAHPVACAVPMAEETRAQPAGLVFFSTSQTDVEENPEPLNGLPGEVVEFTQVESRLRRMSVSVKASARIHALAAGAENMHAFESGATEIPAMFTLTHRPGETPDPKDVSRFVDNLRKWCARKWNHSKLRYVWVAELQTDRSKRGDFGAVHYHICAWLPARLYARRRPGWKASHVLPKPDRKGWWKKGSSERAWVEKSVTGYLSKYLSKGGEGGGFPKGLRTHGAGGFNAPERDRRAWLVLPMWLAKQVTPADRVQRLPAGQWQEADGSWTPGGGWVSRLTGDCFRSPWRLVAFGRVVRIVRIFSDEQLSGVYSNDGHSKGE